MSKRLGLVLALAVPLVGACHDGMTGPAVRTQVVSVEPVGGATTVPATAPVVVTFSGPMAAGMEARAMLHDGDLSGPAVPGEWTWSADRTRLTFIATPALRPAHSYTLHLGGAMVDADGMRVGFDRCVSDMGGAWATTGMMGSGMMGADWRDANGDLGMTFGFTTE